MPKWKFEGPVQPTRELVARYQSALLNEWSHTAFVEVLYLARNTLATAGVYLLFSEEIPQKKADAAAFKTQDVTIVTPYASDDLLDYIARRNEEQNEKERRRPPRENYPDEQEILAGYAAHLVTHFSLASSESFNPIAMAYVEDPTGFYRDVRSLLYLLTCYEFMPWIRSPETNALLLPQAMHVFARFEWDDMPNQRANLLAALAETLGNSALSSDFREEALDATSPDSHEYLTVTQSVIFSLLDARRYADAKHLLFHCIRTMDSSFDDEIMELCRQVFAPHPSEDSDKPIFVRKPKPK